jgi:hypothetical protein
MVMRMLEAGGMAVMSDGIRAADESNPRGYYEYERVKTLDKDADKSWLEAARGKAIKIISFLLKDLPDSNHYRVILMQRDMDEVLTSQRKMLQALEGVRRPERQVGRSRTSEPSEASADERIASGYRAHLQAVDDLLATRTCFDVLSLSYGDVISRSSEQAERINQFLGGGLDVSKMAAAVDPALYRNRG